MRRNRRWILPLAVPLLLVGVPWIVHLIRPSRALDVVIVNKTVPFRNFVEHRSLFWILDHRKVIRPDGGAYRKETDYVGAHPPAVPGGPPERVDLLTDRRVLAAHLLYLADTYGVYRDDLASGPAMRAALERSPEVHGGLEAAEAAAARSYVQRGGTLVAEFNTLGSPTADRARRDLEDLLGVRWTHWIGRYFADLESRDEVPQWLRRDYEAEWGQPWDFRGPGWVLVQDDAHVEVLRVGEEARGSALVLEREPPVDPLLDGAADAVPYPYWFDVVERAAGTEVLASFRFRLTAAGSARLKARGLPEVFPAVTRRRHETGGAAYYFAGDFSDNPMFDVPVPLAGWPLALRWLHGLSVGPSETAFYWRFYVPMVSRLLEDLPEPRLETP
jgi:hypothetical protein